MSEAKINETKLSGLLGLCRRAGKLFAGMSAVQKALDAGKVCAVFADEAIAQNTLERMQKKCKAQSVPLCLLPEGLLERALGEYHMLCCVCDPNFARGLKQLLP